MPLFLPEPLLEPQDGFGLQPPPLPDLPPLLEPQPHLMETFFGFHEKQHPPLTWSNSSSFKTRIDLLLDDLPGTKQRVLDEF
ncbi:MAG: hypothetical protein ABI564_10815 [Ideonella sp.]